MSGSVARGHVGRSALAACAAGAVAAGAIAACTEGGLTSVEGEDTPGQGAETRQLVVVSDSFPLWRDTTVQGFITRNTFGPELVALDSGGFQSRSLYAFPPLADSVSVDGEDAAIDSVTSMLFVLRPDTLRSTLSGDSATVSIYSLSRDFDAEEASWTLARDGEPWTMPGGDLEALLAEERVGLRTDSAGRADSVGVELDLPPDSLARAWRDQDVSPRLAVAVSDPGFRIWLNTMDFRLFARPADQDTVVLTGAIKVDDTFIHDPQPPDVGTELRVGGIPATRFYTVFRPPDSAQGLPIKGAAVNRAELIFHPLPSADGPFEPRQSISLVPVRLLADPFEFGEKTPIGGPAGGGGTFTVDSLESGRPLRFDVTGIISSWASAATDTTISIRIGIRGTSDAQLLGFYEFASLESGAATHPELRLVITPPTPFDLP